jgi:pentatricopeptide repeat protein
MEKAIRTGKKFDGRLELSRAYLEAGKLLSDPQIPQKKLNGLTKEDCFKKAKTLFEEMDLQWDLGELRKATKD